MRKFRRKPEIFTPYGDQSYANPSVLRFADFLLSSLQADILTQHSREQMLQTLLSIEQSGLVS